MTIGDRHQRVMALFDAVCDLAPAKQAAYLDEHVGDDEEVRREVELMLGLDAEPSNVIPDDPGSVINRMAAEIVDTDAAALGVPDEIGGYRILRLIGEGGMGIIYEAEQESPRRRVALKVLRSQFVGPKLLRRFRLEAHVLGQLLHSGIAQIYEASVTDTRGGLQPYIVMEFVDGLPLIEHADAAALDANQRLRLIARVCDAVHHAHQKGVIHRDLKPSNILVAASPTHAESEDTSVDVAFPDAIGQPKVLDFGIARVIDEDDKAITVETDAGQLVGTLAYMSPEQVAGAGDIDTRSDVYALGVMTYELLTGSRPLDVSGTSVADAARIIQDKEPTRLGSHDRKLRGDVETIIGKTLEKDRERRYDSVAQFAADIRRYLASEPIAARPATALYQLRRFARRNKGLVGGIAAAIVVLILGLVAASVLAVREGNARRNSEDATHRASLAAAAAALRDEDVVTARRHLDDTPGRLRGWFWSYLDARLDDSVAVVPLAHEPNRQDIERGLGYLWFWDDDGAVTSALQSRQGGLSVCTFDAGVLHARGTWRLEDVLVASPRDHAIFVQRDTGEAHVYDTLSGQTHAEAAPMPTSVERILLTRHVPDDVADRFSWFQINSRTSGRGTVRLVFSRDGSQVVTFAGPDATLLAAGGDEDPIPIPQSREPYADGVFSPDGRRLYLCALDRSITCFDLDEDASIRWRREMAHADAALAIALNADGTILATGGEDRVVRIWDASNGEPLDTMLGHTGTVFRLAFDSTGRKLASTTAEHLRMWGIAESGGLQGVTDMGRFVRSMTLGSDGALVASVDRTHMYLWDGPTGIPVARMALPETVVPDGISIVGRAIVLRTPEKSYVRDLLTRGVKRVGGGMLPGNRGPNGGGDTLLIARSAARTFTVDARSGAVGERLYDFEGRVDWVARDGAFAITMAAQDPSVRLYDVKNGGVVRAWPRSTERDSNRAIYLRDENVVAIGDRDGVIRLHAVRGDDEPTVLEGHTDAITCLTSMPEERLLVSGSRDRTIRVWDLERRREIGALRGHQDKVNVLVALPGGQTILSASEDRTIRRWDSFPRRDLEAARAAYEGAVLLLEPLVREQLGELGDPSLVADWIEGAPELSERDRQIALQILIRVLWVHDGPFRSRHR